MPEQDASPGADLIEKAEAAADRQNRRGRPRRHIRISEPVSDPDNNGGSGVAIDDQGIPLVDESELAEIQRQMSPSDKLLAPIEDYRNLSAVTGRPIIWLVKNAVDPYKCSLTVERRAPAMYKRRKVKLGVLRGYSCNWPFDLDTVKARLEAEQGGEEYVFIVKHDAKPLRALNVNIDDPPKFDPELTMGDHEIDGTEPLDEIEKERIREERMTRMLQSRQMRLRAAKEVEKEEAPPAPDIDPADMMPPGASDEDVQRMLAEQEERITLKHEIRDIREDSNRRFETLLGELRNSRSDGGGNNAIIQAMQASTTAMMEGLKIVVANVADQIKSSNESSKEQFANVLKLMEMSQQNSRLLTEAQIGARSRETELLLEVAGSKHEMAAMTADKQMDLMKQGMEFARQLQPAGDGGGDAEMGWANKAANMLTQIIGGKLAANVMAPALPTPAQAAASQAPAAMTPEVEESAAKRIAARALAHIQAARTGQPVAPTKAPASAPAPANGEKAAFVRSLWAMLNTELDSRPAQSRFTAAVISGPPEFLAGIGKAEKITEIISLVAPYVPTDQIGAVGAKMLDAEAQQWTLNQIVQIKAAYAQVLDAQAARRAPAPAPEVPAPVAPVAAAPKTEPAAEAAQPAQPEGESTDA